MQAVVLGSGSQYRAQLLTRLNIRFTTISPDIDESAKPDELPVDLAARLARQKAHKAKDQLIGAVHATQPQQPAHLPIIIASDQVASNSSIVLGKPGTVEKACSQLASMSGSDVTFFTSLFMLNTRTDATFSAMDVTQVKLRKLDAHEIARYVAADDPLQCAGSFKVESLGISLFQAIQSDDPTALIGLPMIKLCEGLRRFGLDVP